MKRGLTTDWRKRQPGAAASGTEAAPALVPLARTMAIRTGAAMVVVTALLVVTVVLVVGLPPAPPTPLLVVTPVLVVVPVLVTALLVPVVVTGNGSPPAPPIPPPSSSLPSPKTLTVFVQARPRKRAASKRRGRFIAAHDCRSRSLLGGARDPST